MGSQDISSQEISNRVAQALKSTRSYLTRYQRRFEQDQREGRVSPLNDGEQVPLDYSSFEIVGSIAVRDNQITDAQRIYLAIRKNK